MSKDGTFQITHLQAPSQATAIEMKGNANSFPQVLQISFAHSNVKSCLHSSFRVGVQDEWPHWSHQEYHSGAVLSFHHCLCVCARQKRERERVKIKEAVCLAANGRVIIATP